MPAKRSIKSQNLRRQLDSEINKCDAAAEKYEIAKKQKNSFMSQLFRKMTAKNGTRPSTADVAKAKELKKRAADAAKKLKIQQAKYIAVANKCDKYCD